MRTAWALDVPAGCPGCATGFGAWPAYLRANAPTRSRWGLLMTTRDQTISQYFGVNQPELATRTLAIRDGMAAGTNQAAFVIDSAAHVLTGGPTAPMTAGGVRLGDWIRDFATASPPWGSVGP